MSEGKHTPGPWRVEEGTTLVWGNCNPEDHTTWGMGYPIAETRINPSGNWSTGPYADEGEANARLIAAAPDMLEALELARGTFKAYDRFKVDVDAILVIESAISKAKGINPDE